MQHIHATFTQCKQIANNYMDWREAIESIDLRILNTAAIRIAIDIRSMNRQWTPHEMDDGTDGTCQMEVELA